MSVYFILQKKERFIMILDVVLNIVAQLMFFIVNIFVIQWLATLAIDKFGEDLPDWLSKPVLVLQSWTVRLASQLIEVTILFLTGNKPSDFDIYLDEGELKIDHTVYPSKYHWYNPIMMLGIYLDQAVWILMGPAISILSLWLMLPETFAMVVDGIGQWTALQSGTTNLAYFKGMLDAFVDIIWNRLIMGGLNENAVLLVIFIALFMLHSNGYTKLYDEEEGEVGPIVFAFPMIAIIIILFNVVFAIVSPTLYLAVSHHINSVGMIALLVIIIKEILSIIMFCFKNIIGLVLKVKR